tara:strand:- start:335 stop:487 length:153 start_codon:yes stop_codon:yes gene_type:complete
MVLDGKLKELAQIGRCQDLNQLFTMRYINEKEQVMPVNVERKKKPEGLLE